MNSLSPKEVAQLLMYILHKFHRHVHLYFIHIFTLCPTFEPRIGPLCHSHIQTGSKFFLMFLLHYINYSSSLKHTRSFFREGLFLQLGHNIYSSVCRPCVFLAHLLLLSENITPLPLMLHSFKGFK